MKPYVRTTNNALREALLAVRIRTIDGQPCWCLLPREVVHRPNYIHDYRCIRARALV